MQNLEEKPLNLFLLLLDLFLLNNFNKLHKETIVVLFILTF
jgi:hypothetical protein